MFTLLRSSMDYEQFKLQPDGKSLAASIVNWGAPPVAYPCLISVVYELTAGKAEAHVCYVYREAAEALLRACTDAGTSDVATPAAKPIYKPELWLEFARKMQATLHAIIELDMQTGVYTMEKFEEVRAKFLARYDQTSVSTFPVFD